ncbi:hypothetical protein, partial [uncultured Bacteroides sp.]|uniref:hypothetical protein n=1 Tax=uncultured Bacteroides sp. TaxID=162156 RepID=UPI0025B72A59
VHRLGDNGRPVFGFSVILCMDFVVSASLCTDKPQVKSWDIRLWRISCIARLFRGNRSYPKPE